LGGDDLAHESIDLRQERHHEPPMGDQRVETLRQAGHI
jgi:hypothetical protein